MSGRDRDPYDLSGCDEDDDYGVETGAVVVLARGYVDEMVAGEFPFLIDDHASRFAHYQDVLAELLSARYGEPVQDDLRLPLFGDFETSTVWRVGTGRLVLQVAENLAGGHYQPELRFAHIVGTLPETGSAVGADS
ncbi:hypothetical protein ACWCXH_10745 [Kitasatospora sp. NPDC001660]